METSRNGSYILTEKKMSKSIEKWTFSFSYSTWQAPSENVCMCKYHLYYI